MPGHRSNAAILLRRSINSAAGEQSEPAASGSRRQQQLLAWRRPHVRVRYRDGGCWTKANDLNGLLATSDVLIDQQELLGGFSVHSVDLHKRPTAHGTRGYAPRAGDFRERCSGEIDGPD